MTVSIKRRFGITAFLRVLGGINVETELIYTAINLLSGLSILIFTRKFKNATQFLEYQLEWYPLAPIVDYDLLFDNGNSSVPSLS